MKALSRKSGCQGVTLIELMIAIAILGVLIALALPNYAIWIQNTQIRTAAESLLNGLQKARVEAARRNTNVEFALGPGTGWSVTVPGTGENIETRLAGDGSANITTTLTAGTKVTFNALGRVTANQDLSASLQRVVLDSNVINVNDSRELQIDVGLGGIIRMCDPKVSDSGDPRKCQP